MPTVSIITTCYNHSKYIGETIESILNQTFTDWELLIGDDNSPDNSYEIALEYTKQDSRIKCWTHKQNLGIVGNLNFLISQADISSQYIAFLEGDDLYTEGHLEKKLKIFSIYPEIQLIYNNLDFINGDSQIFYTNFLKKAPFYLRNETLSKKDFLTHESFYGSYSSLMVRKETLLKEKIMNIHPQDKLFTVSDWDLFFRLATTYNTYGIQDSLTLYRRHQNNVSSNTLKLFNDLELQISYYLDHKYISQDLYDYKLGFIYILKSVAYIEKYERKKSCSYLFKALSKNMFSYALYKSGLLLLIMSPSCVIKKFLQQIIKRQ